MTLFFSSVLDTISDGVLRFALSVDCAAFLRCFWLKGYFQQLIRIPQWKLNVKDTESKTRHLKDKSINKVIKLKLLKLKKVK